MNDLNKTDPPTQKKLQKARKKGRVARSPLLSFSLLLAAVFILLYFVMPPLGKKIETLFLEILQTPTYTETHFYSLWREFLVPIALLVGGLLIGIFLFTLLSSFVQTGWIWSWKKEGGGEKSYFVLPLIALAITAFFLLRSEKPTSSLLLSSSFLQQHLIWMKILFFSGKLIFLLLIGGIFDFFYQKLLFIKSMKMTREEIKEERKEEEMDRDLKRRLHKRS